MKWGNLTKEIFQRWSWTTFSGNHVVHDETSCLSSLEFGDINLCTASQSAQVWTLTAAPWFFSSVCSKLQLWDRWPHIGGVHGPQLIIHPPPTFLSSSQVGNNLPSVGHMKSQPIQPFHCQRMCYKPQHATVFAGIFIFLAVVQEVEQVLSERAVVQSPVPVVNTGTDESPRACGVEALQAGTWMGELALVKALWVLS